MVIITAKLLRKKIWLRAENPLSQEISKGKKLLFVKKIILKTFLFPFVNKFLYIGTESKNFFLYYGIKQSRLLFTPYAVDNDFFQQQRSMLTDIGNIKRMLSLPLNKKIILFSGKYIEKKNPLDLIEAFYLLNDPDVALVMVGEGEMRAAMENFITENRVKNVFLTGFVNQSAIAKYYAVADVFVMCSGQGETWGLSVNEAMNFAKPVIVSKTCGCCADLVRGGVNGFSFREGDVHELHLLLKKTFAEPDLINSYGNASLKIINGYNINCIVNNMISGLYELNQVV